jgi:hypothetical protein
MKWNKRIIERKQCEGTTDETAKTYKRPQGKWQSQLKANCKDID